MKIADKDDEVLIRGRNVMIGYYNNPEATAQALDGEGFYHTGDVGYVDTDGHFYITDRLKDLFKLSNGKYVAPLQVESLLKQSPLISQPVVVGSGRKQVGVLIVPDWEALKEEMKAAGTTCRAREKSFAKTLPLSSGFSKMLSTSRASSVTMNASSAFTCCRANSQ
jgi:long-subunit acyl-CoA synthetase (AMP-forming)